MENKIKIFLKLSVFVLIVFSLLSCAGNGIKFPLNEKQNLTGYLFKPEGKGPFPAVLLMHGCGGLNVSYEQWAERLVREGYAVFMVDSLSGGRFSNLCTGGRPTPDERAYDAIAARRYLESQSFINSRKIALIGFSHGAVTALHTATNEQLFGDGKEFQAIVAFYPYCRIPGNNAAKLLSPLMILIGEKDDWCPARHCLEYRNYFQNSFPEMSLKIYPGAYHGFDFPNTDITYMGHILKSDKNALEDSIVMVKNFLNKYLR
jgi:dienelactone hydrolase